MVNELTVERAAQALTNNPNLRHHQQEDSFVGKVNPKLGAKGTDGTGNTESGNDASGQAAQEPGGISLTEAEKLVIKTTTQGTNSTGKAEVGTSVSDEVVREPLMDEKGVIWFAKDNNKPLIAVAAVMVIDILALVHTSHGHAGVAATLSLTRDRFHWPSVVKDTRQ